MLFDAIIFFGTNEEFTIKQGGVYTYLGNCPCPLPQQQWYKSKQHHLWSQYTSLFIYHEIHIAESKDGKNKKTKKLKSTERITIITNLF